MKKTYWKIFCIVLFAGVLSALALCGFGCAGEKEDFRVGVILQLTADDAAEADAVQAAISKVIVGLNNAGGIRGRQVKVIIVNGLKEESETLLVSKKLMEMDYTHAVVCYAGQGLTPAIPRVFAKGRTPLLLFGPEKIDTDMLNDWVFAMPAPEGGYDESAQVTAALNIVYGAIKKSGRDKARIRRNIQKAVSTEK